MSGILETESSSLFSCCSELYTPNGQAMCDQYPQRQHTCRSHSKVTSFAFTVCWPPIIIQPSHKVTSRRSTQAIQAHTHTLSAHKPDHPTIVIVASRKHSFTQMITVFTTMLYFSTSQWKRSALVAAADADADAADAAVLKGMQMAQIQHTSQSIPHHAVF